MGNLRENKKMNEKLRRYFVDLEKRNLPKKDGLIIESEDGFKERKPLYVESSSRDMYTYELDGIPYIAKIGNGFFQSRYAHEIASSRMLNDLGFLTPIQHPIKVDAGKYNKPSMHLGVVSQDINSIPTIKPVIAQHIKELESLSIEPFNTFIKTSQWHVLLDNNVKDKCMEFMTPECYDEIIKFFCRFCNNFAA